MKGNLDFLQKSFFSLKTYSKILSINKADDKETEEIQKLQSWPSPHHNKKSFKFILSLKIFLMTLIECLTFIFYQKYFYDIMESRIFNFDMTTHCIKGVRIRSYSGPHFSAFGLNTDQNNSKYGFFARST